MDMVNSCESTSVVDGIIETILYASYVEGEARVLWSKMEANKDIKRRIEMKIIEEEEEMKMLLDAQFKTERMMRQEEARSRWLSVREERVMNELANSLNIMTVKDISTDADSQLFIMPITISDTITLTPWSL